jgi:hypothetical protein
MVSLRRVTLYVAASMLAACGGSDSSSPPPVAGPPTAILKTAGDNQTADPGTAVAIAPSVTIQDAQGKPVPGIVVTFSIGDGSGSLTNPTPVTNSAGVATLGGWKLGPRPGVSNTVVVTVGDLPAQTFTATTSGTNPCTVATPYTVGSTTTGTFTTGDCPAADDGTFLDFYSTTIATQGMYVFTQTGAFKSYLLLDGQGSIRVAEDGDANTPPTGATLTALLAPGSYTLIANTLPPPATGDYTLSSSQVSSSIENCSDVFVTRGVTTDQTLTNTDCANGGFLSDDVFVFIGPGESITVSMNSTAFDAYLEIYARPGVLVMSNDDKDATTTNAQLTYTSTSPFGDYYLISPTSKLSGAPGATGAYTLIIQ